MSSEAIVLAGGIGSRLKSVVSDRPKPMAEIQGKPFLDYLLTYLKTQNITRVIFSVGHMYDMIQDYFKHEFSGIEICYAIEKEPLGTGGGIRNALKKTKEDHIFVVNGDTFFPVDFAEMTQLAAHEKTDLIIALYKTNEQNRYGSIVMNEKNRITHFMEKAEVSESSLINGGIYLLNTKEFSKLEFSGKFSFEKDYLEKYVSSMSFLGIIFNEYFIDIGIPETYLKAQKDFSILQRKK